MCSNSRGQIALRLWHVYLSTTDISLPTWARVLLQIKVFALRLYLKRLFLGHFDATVHELLVEIIVLITFLQKWLTS